MQVRQERRKSASIWRTARCWRDRVVDCKNTSCRRGPHPKLKRSLPVRVISTDRDRNLNPNPDPNPTPAVLEITTPTTVEEAIFSASEKQMTLRELIQRKKEG